jgi:hypothetical protein
VGILRIPRALVWRVQEVIPSEGTAVDVFVFVLALCCYLLKSISQALVVVIVFFGAQLRHATKSFVPSFLLTFFTQPFLKLLPMSSLNSSFLPKP